MRILAITKRNLLANLSVCVSIQDMDFTNTDLASGSLPCPYEASDMVNNAARPCMPKGYGQR